MFIYLNVTSPTTSKRKITNQEIYDLIIDKEILKQKVTRDHQIETLFCLAKLQKNKLHGSNILDIQMHIRSSKREMYMNYKIIKDLLMIRFVIPKTIEHKN